jgi:hypothetical protein
LLRELVGRLDRKLGVRIRHTGRGTEAKRCPLGLPAEP